LGPIRAEAFSPEIGILSKKSQILITVSIAMLKYKKKFCDELIRSDIVNSKVEMSEVIRSI
jgi:hypothetical protein